MNKTNRFYNEALPNIEFERIFLTMQRVLDDAIAKYNRLGDRFAELRVNAEKLRTLYDVQLARYYELARKYADSTLERAALYLVLAEVVEFNDGAGKYDYSRLGDYERGNATEDAWRGIRKRIDKVLAVFKRNSDELRQQAADIERRLHEIVNND